MKRENSVEEELIRLMHTHGRLLSPQHVVDAARSPTSPLHNQFDWDDSEAAEKWRRQQARVLLRVVVAYQPGAHGKMVAHRVMVSLTPDRKHEDGGYRLMADVMSDETLKAQLLMDARGEMKTFRAKYARLEELAEVFAAMERVEEEHDDTQEESDVSVGDVNREEHASV